MKNPILGYVIVDKYGYLQIATDWPDGPKRALSRRDFGTLFPNRKLAYAYIKRSVQFGEKKNWVIWKELAQATVWPIRAK